MIFAFFSFIAKNQGELKRFLILTKKQKKFIKHKRLAKKKTQINENLAQWAQFFINCQRKGTPNFVTTMGRGNF